MDTFIREVESRTFVLAETRIGNNFEVFEITGGKRIELTRDVDLPDIETLTDDVLLAMAEPRRVGLAAMMEQYRIVSGPDYQYDEDYALLYSTTPVGRYVQVAGDWTYHWIKVCETREDAAAAVRRDILNQGGAEYPRHPIEIRDLDRHPIEIRDLDTGRSISWSIEVIVTLVD